MTPSTHKSMLHKRTRCNRHFSAKVGAVMERSNRVPEVDDSLVPVHDQRLGEDLGHANLAVKAPCHVTICAAQARQFRWYTA